MNSEGEAEARYRVELLGDHHRRGEFSCGVEDLDGYFYTRAGQDMRREVARVYVAVEQTSGDVVGYFTLSAYYLRPRSLPDTAKRKLPRYDVFPAILLGRLAVDRRCQKQGLGGSLLLRALRECYVASRRVAAMAVVVDTKDDSARAFYEHFAFRRCQDHEHRLYIPMTEVARLF